MLNGRVGVGDGDGSVCAHDLTATHDAHTRVLGRRDGGALTGAMGAATLARMASSSNSSEGRGGAGSAEEVDGASPAGTPPRFDDAAGGGGGLSCSSLGLGGMR
mmetsp:Transcript_53217/g.119456  ORF Transcript_53217/g.119456 Transcript_53217/m.119456 type:complete len:104 (-) Transcript_53217:150-461(-)